MGIDRGRTASTKEEPIMTELKSVLTPIHRAADIPVFTVTDAETDEDPGTVLFYGTEFTGDDTFVSPSPYELVLWADGRGPVEITYRTISNPPEG